MMRFVNASFHYRCGSVTTRGLNGVMSFLRFKKRGVIKLAPSVVSYNHSYAKATEVEIRQPGSYRTHQSHRKL